MVVDRWHQVSLGDFVSLQRGHDLPDHQRKPGLVPILGSFGITGYHNQAKVKGPGVTIGRSGASFGTVSYSTVDFWPLNTALFVTDFHGNDECFSYYLLRCLDFKRYDSGSAQPSLNRNYIRSIPVCVPPLNEQRAIARILATLDDKIESNRQMNETLGAMARGIFKSWFVDFDPVRAKSEGRQPYGMDAATVALFPDSFKNSRLGKIPKSWHSLPLSEAFEINPPRSLTKGRRTTYLDMQNMPTKGHCPHGWIERAFVSGSRFINGDTLVARITPCLENGKTAYVDFLRDGEVAWGSTEFIVFRPKAPLPPEFGYCLARDEAFRDFAIQNMTGSSGRQRVPTDCFGGYSIVVPPEVIAKAFRAAVRPFFEKVKVNTGEASTLKSIRETLLPKLISGEIRVQG
jgi:type I restriction enzyme, S subunit